MRNGPLGHTGHHQTAVGDLQLDPDRLWAGTVRTKRQLNLLQRLRPCLVLGNLQLIHRSQQLGDLPASLLGPRQLLL
jgi:hypothetical protein